MTAEEYALCAGPLDGCTFSVEEDAISGHPAVVVPPGQENLWFVASFDEQGEKVRFLTGPSLDSRSWTVHQYSYWKPGRYQYAGVLVRGDGRATAADVVRKLKGEG